MKSVWGIPQSLGIITTFKYISLRQHKKKKMTTNLFLFIEMLLKKIMQI